MLFPPMKKDFPPPASIFSFFAEKMENIRYLCAFEKEAERTDQTGRKNR